MGDKIMQANQLFTIERLIRFSHSDPAGIVYYPNFFDMFNHLVEDWFYQRLGIDYGRMIAERRVGLPTVKAECEFVRPCSMGEKLVLSLRLDRIGRSSMTLSIGGSVGGEERFRGSVVLVFTSLDTHRSIAIPDDIMARVREYYESTGQSGETGR